MKILSLFSEILITIVVLSGTVVLVAPAIVSEVVDGSISVLAWADDDKDDGEEADDEDERGRKDRDDDQDGEDDEDNEDNDGDDEDQGRDDDEDDDEDNDNDDDDDRDDRDHKVDVCHVSPGNPANAHVVRVDAHAWNRGHSPHNAGNPGHSLDFLMGSGDSCPRSVGGPAPTPGGQGGSSSQSSSSSSSSSSSTSESSSPSTGQVLGAATSQLAATGDGVLDLVVRFLGALLSGGGILVWRRSR